MSRDLTGIPLEEQIRQILLMNWDPVEIGENASLRDEYDDYIGDIVKLLSNTSTSVATIRAYLWRIEFEWMGLDPDENRLDAASAKLFELTNRR